MSYISPMIENDGQSTASKSDTIEVSKAKIIDDLPESKSILILMSKVPAKGGQRKSVLVT